VSKIRVIALTTFRELIREKFFLVIVFVAIFLFGLSLLLGELSFDEAQKILADIGFLAIQISSIGLALFTGSFMLSREIEKQTCLLMLSRPVTRTEFLIGKLSGVILLITLLNLSLTLALTLLLGAWSSFGNMLEISFSLWLEAIVILSLVFLLSIFLRPVLAVMTGVTVYFAGSWLDDLSFFAKKSNDAAFKTLAEIAQWIFPNFYRFNWKNYFFLQKGLTSQDMTALSLHYIPWVILLLIAATYLFRRKDIV
jgi:ABC-type transport system involved in multi-copper enzyme maturation permease subunit